MMRTLYLCGAGNPEGVRLALNVNDKEDRWDRILLLDDDPSKRGRSILGVEIVGSFDLLGQADPEADEVSNMVASKTARRWSARRRIAEFGLRFATLIDPSVDMRGVTFGEDITIYTNATVCACSSLGVASTVLMGALVGHDCQLGKCCVVAPGAVLNGRVKVEDGVYVGTNASVLPDLRVGAWATIGSNSAVIEDVPPGATVIGVPAQILMAIDGSPDRKAVSSIRTHRPLRERDSPPLSPLEETLTGLWARVLDADEIGIHDNFLELGGNSLSAVRVCYWIREALGIEIPLQTLFEFPTVAALAKRLDQGSYARGMIRDEISGKGS